LSKAISPGFRSSMKKKNVLIVEDDPVIQNLIELRLKTMGYEVCGKVYTGEEALVQVKKLRPNVVLMDISLKGEIDGIEAARLIKRDFKIPIIFLTGYADDQTLSKVWFVRPDGFIRKPFDDNDLRIALELVP